MTQHIALIGKGGVGKSTLVANLSAALTEAGFSIMQVGCDPKGDSCSILNSGVPVPTVFDLLLNSGEITVESVVHYGFKRIACVELGDPFHAGGSASGEIAVAFEHLDRIGLFEAVAPDFVLYDIPGATFFPVYFTPIRKVGVSRVFVVTSADFMSLHAANAIFKALGRQGDIDVPAPVHGLISNGIASTFEESFIEDFAKCTQTRAIGSIPRSLIVRQCELYGKTVIEASPLSNQSYFYRRLANLIVDELQSDQKGQPVPLQAEQLQEWAKMWGDRIYALENGLVTDGASI
jgi:nitrogenase iron protein NifH